jgi:PIN domain nuclease of toxin-antitoxin system
VAYLLDTNAILFGLLTPDKIKPSIRALMNDPANRLCASVASIYEINFKVAIGKLWLPDNFDVTAHLIQGDTELLSINPFHAAAASRLPLINRDPWDRLIAAQALNERLTLISSDRAIQALGVKTLW